jgi:hypothetical protein
VIYYNLYNKILIELSPSISESIKKQINFQINWFKQNSKNPPIDCEKIIRINNYSSFDASKYNLKTIFHLTQGGKTTFHNPNKKLAVIKTEKGFDIYAHRYGFILNQYLQILLLECGISFVHAGGVVDDKGKAILFPGPGGVGKTAVINLFLEQKGYKLLGDDIIGIDSGGNCYPFPREFVLKPYHYNEYQEIFKSHNVNLSDFNKKGLIENNKNFLNSSFIKKVDHYILRNLPFYGVLLSLWYRFGFYKISKTSTSYFTVPVEKIYGENKIALIGEIDKIYFLHRVNSDKIDSEDITIESLVSRMFSIINHEWCEGSRDLFSIGAFEFINLKEYFDKTYSIIKGFVGSSKKNQIIHINKKASPKELQNFVQSQL